MLRSSLVVGVILLLPHHIISEPAKNPPLTTWVPPIEILISGFAAWRSDSSVLLKIQSNDTSLITSSCPHTKKIFDTTDERTLIEWELTHHCDVPMIQYKWVKYLVPIQNSFPGRDTLSDISTETLKNTLKASTKIRNMFQFSTQNQRNFFNDIETIVQARASRFSLPIPGKLLPSNHSFLPNAGRPYRAGNTDGIHHGWDFYVEKWSNVRAVEDGIIVHVKRDFSWDEMNHLHEGNSELELQENLEIFRGNTVYLKTVSWHVAIYAHLSDIPNNIQIGTRVSKWETLWRVWDSAVPSKKYLYHLHFEIALNPFHDETAGKYTFSDMLLWPFWWKNKSIQWVEKNDDNLFE